ncbi:MAG: beta strand repeat-containing protein [Spirochaetota bacterium]
MPGRTLCHILVFLVLLLISACKEYSTNDFLSAKFPTGGTKGLRITAPSPITVGQPFTITVTATNTVRPDGIQQEYQNPVNLTLQVGGGTLTSVTGGGWFLGTQNFTVVYNNPSLSLNSTEVILLRVTDSTDTSFTTVSNNITATSQVVFNQFKVVAPGTAFKGQPFNITITATNSDNTTNTAYNGTVNLSTYLVAGTITPSSVTGFVNGVVTVSITLSDSYTSLQLRAVDSVTATLSGLSNTFQVYFDSVALAAFAQSASAIRVTWNYPTGTTQALVYRDSGSGFQLLSTIYLPTANYTDTAGLIAGQTYSYRVIVQDNLGTLQYQATTTAVPSGCTTSVAGTVTSETWTPAQSPYCVTGNVSITGTLTISAGTIVLVNPTFSITVASGGSLIAQGTQSAQVVFTSANASPTPGNWGGIIFATGAVGSTITSDNYSSGSLLQYALVEYAGPGITTAESLYLDNCTIQNNRTTTTNGAGISANQAAGKQIVMRNTLILNNTVATTLYGGGLYATQRAAIYSSKFFNNSVAHVANFLRGGAAYLAGDANLITSSQFFNNSLSSAQSNHQGGALYIVGDFNVMTGNTFQGNFISLTNTAHGAAAYLLSNNNNVINNIFSGNTATAVTAGSFGGALVINGFGNTLTRNTFSGNTSTGSNSSGGALTFGNNNTATYNLFTTNAATRGGAIFVNGTTATVNHNQLISNTGTSGNNVFYGAAGTLDFTNNYWGGATSGQTALGICDGSNTGGSCATSSGTIDASSARATVWPLCKTAPSDPDCVGANF